MEEQSEYDSEHPESSPIERAIDAIRNPGKNLAPDLDEGTRGKIAQRIKEDWEADKDSRREWFERTSAAMDLAMQIMGEKNTPWEHAANVKYPLLTTAAIQFNARAYPSIVQGRNVVKGKIIGRDDQGQKAAMSQRIAEHLNWQLLEEMPEWEEGTDKLLICLPIDGCCFRKTYFDPDKGRNCSELVRAKDLVVSHAAKCLSDAPRITHEIHIYPHRIVERQRTGYYDDVDLMMGDEGDREEQQLLLEQHMYFDLDEDGLKEPYIATLHAESEKLLRLIPNWDEEGVFVMAGGRVLSLADVFAEMEQRKLAVAQQAQAYYQQYGYIPDMPPERPGFDGMEIAKFRHVEYFTKYSLVPNPDGGFYDVGLGWLLYPISATVDTVLNQLLDAATKENTGGGMIDDSVQIGNRTGGTVRYKPGEYFKVRNRGGAPLNQMIYEFNAKGPSTTLFQLLGLLIDAGKDVSGVKDVLSGDLPGGMNVQATVMMAMIEQGMQVFSAIYKRVYRSLGDELRKLYRLNRLYLEPEQYFVINDDERVIRQTDYQGDGTDVVPVADPTVSTKTQKLAQAQGLMQFINDPMHDQFELRRRIHESMGTPDLDRLLVPPQPGPPGPEEVKAMSEAKLKEAQAVKIMMEAEKVKADIQKTLAQAAEALAKAEAAEAGTQIDQYRAQLEAISAQLNEGARKDELEQSRAGRMAGGPDNQAGLIQLSR